MLLSLAVPVFSHISMRPSKSQDLYGSLTLTLNLSLSSTIDSAKRLTFDLGALSPTMHACNVSIVDISLRSRRAFPLPRFLSLSLSMSMSGDDGLPGAEGGVELAASKLERPRRPELA
mmetsp:Transcript_48323/g.104052  ORF Transcript_48323/g.104052 Transcript_48323/m.104052 type:complete len:118 (-) Transcript_48323:88-441(-)